MSNAETVANLAQKNSRNALQRLDAVEQTQAQVVQALNSTLGPLQQQFSQYVEIVDAVTAILGDEVVANRVAEIRKERAIQQAEVQAQQVKTLVANGILAVASVIGEKSLIVGKEFDKEGHEMLPGRRQALLSQIRTDLQEKLMGQGVGFKLDTGDGAFEVLEVYDVIEKTAPTAEAAPAAAPATAETEATPKES